MKKILTTVIASGFGLVVFAQGTVNWTGVGPSFIGQTNATVFSSFVASSGSPSGGSSGNTALAVGGIYYYALLTSASLNTAPTSLTQFSGTLSTAWLSTGLQATNNTGSNGRIVQYPAVQNAGTSNWVDTATQNILMVGWSANLGTTWASALANLNNWSNFGTNSIGPAFFGVGQSVGSLTIGSANPGITVLGASVGQINDTVSGAGPLVMNILAIPSLGPVPEPSTMALAALGGASLLLFRRRK